MKNAAQPGTLQLHTQIEALQRELAAAQRYRAVFSATREGLLLLNDEGVYVEVNPAYAELLKSTPDQVTGRHFSEFIPPERLADAQAAFADVKAGGTGLREFPLRAVDGSLVDCEWTVRPHFLPGISLCAARQIVERKRAEESLRASEARFRAAASAVSSLIWTSNAQGETEDEQPGWCNFTGQTFEECRGYGWANAVHPDDAQPTVEEWRRAVADRRMVACEHRVRRKDGVYRLFSIRAVPVLDSSGAVREWVGVHTDITEERQLTQALRESEERLRLAQSAAGIGNWDWDIPANRIAWSPEIDRLFGLEPRQIEVSHQTWQERLHPDDALRVVTECQQAVERGDGIDTEYRIVRPDGEVRWVLSRARVYRNESGNAVRMLGLAIDITERKRLELRAAFLVELDDATRPLADPRAIIRAVADRLGQHLVVNRCIYAELDDDQDHFSIDSDYIRDARSMAGSHALTHFGADCLQSMRAGQPCVIDDVEADPRTAHVLVSYRAAGIGAAIWAPLCKEGRLVASMAVHDQSTRRWQPDEVELVQQVASRCWESMERARAEGEARRQSHKFDAVLSNVPDFICTFDLAGRFTYANEALLQLWGKALSEILGKNTSDLGYPPELAARLQHEVQTVIETGQTVRNVMEFSGADGEVRVLEYILPPVFDSAGRVEAVTCTAHDISRRVRIERELAESRQRLQQVFSQAPLAIAVFRGPQFVVELANPTFKALVFGRELLGRPFAECVPELGSDVWSALHYVFDRGKPFSATEWHIPYDQNHDGKIEDHWFHVAGDPLREPDGVVTGVVAVGTEVTTQVLARRGLERANRELEEFAFVASHDLQEPLRMVGIYSQLLLARHLPDDARAQEYVGFVREGVRRMERLIQDLLSYSRIVHTETTEATASLDEALAQARHTMDNRLREACATVTAGPLPMVHGDTSQLALVFQNLLSNSVKYRAPERPLHIEIAARKNGEQWTISLRDNGIGFQQQYAERIFGLFKRLHKDEYSGTGLGLAICQRIVERYGGRIWAEGKVGEGAIFYFDLNAAGAT